MATREKKNHLFVSGLVSRSGTTLLQLVLSAHPEISISPETHSIEYALKTMHQHTLDVDSVLLAEFAKNDAKLNSWPGFDFSELAPLLAQSPRTKVRDFMDRLFSLHDAKFLGDPAWTGNKKGLYGTGLAATVKKVYPKAKFLFIYRDPRDSVPSILRNLHHLGRDHVLHEIGLRHRAINATLDAFPDSCLVLRFEDLVSDPESACGQICRFLDLAFDPAMVRFHEANANGERLLGATTAIHQRTRTPFDPGRIDAWREALPKSEALAIQSGLGDLMNQYGYQPLAE